MKAKNIILATAALLSAASLDAQNTRQYFGGRLLRMPDFSITDMMQFSQQSYSFGTARSAAMGGAFASLGADLSSMAINPAGLGMYRSSEFSFSPSLTWTKSESSFPGSYTPYEGDRFTRFAPGNIGIALNTFQSTGALTSLTFGFAYNKLADFNHRTDVGLWGQEYSVNDAFAEQLRGFSPSVLSSKAWPSPWRNENIAVNQWGAVLGYQCWAVNETDPENHRYQANLWGGESTDSRLTSQTAGRVGEYDFSMGMNFRNKFYLGFTLGIQDIYYREDNYFSEEYTASGLSGDETLRYFEYGQYRRYAGTGVNFKVGMIFRPVEELRIGLAVHTPSLVSLDQEYQIYDMYLRHQNGMILDDPGFTDYAVGKYGYSSPPRLLAGISYQIGEIALLSADYECVWYNGMRLSEPEGYYVTTSVRNAFKDDVKYCFRPANNVRLGAEIRPLPNIALRAGYAYYDSGISDHDFVAPTDDTALSNIDNPVATRTSNYSLGAGFRTGGFSLDLAYVLSKADYTKYAMFWYYEPSYGGESALFGSGPVSTTLTRNILTLTAGFRF